MKPVCYRFPMVARSGTPALAFTLALLLALALSAGCGDDEQGGPSGPVTRTVAAGGGGDFVDIQSCILNSNNGDTCLVYAGTYGPVNFLGKAVTVQSASGPDHTFIDGLGTTTAVLFINYETQASTLKGFTIQNGSARASKARMARLADSPAAASGEEHGGGIRILSASPTIQDCVVSRNRAEGDGGGIFCAFAGAAPRLRHIVFRENRAENGRGGGLYVFSGSPQLRNCLFFDNEAANGGAAAATFGARLLLSSCTLCNHPDAGARSDVAGAQTRTNGVYLYNASAAIEYSICWTRILDHGSEYTDVPILLDFDPNLSQGYQTTLSLVSTLVRVKYDSTFYGRISNPGDLKTEACENASENCTLNERPVCFEEKPETYYPRFVSLALDDPQAVPDLVHDFFLEQQSAGQQRNSPALDMARPRDLQTGECEVATTATQAGLDDRTTENGDSRPQKADGNTGREPAALDGVLDLGYHYPITYP